VSIGQGHVRNPEKYNNKTVNEWHKQNFGKQCTAIDVDLGGYCEKCYAWLYFIEASETEAKPTGLVQRLALHSGAVALLIIHGSGEVLRARRVHPDRTGWMTEPQLRSYIRMIRQAHKVQHAQPSVAPPA
jgi:hypothetical protein